jgi:cyclic lactone autoinducer peptide
MEKIKKFNLINILGKCIASFALIVTTLSVNTACVFIAHQSKLPESAKELQKF